MASCRCRRSIAPTRSGRACCGAAYRWERDTDPSRPLQTDVEPGEHADLERRTIHGEGSGCAEAAATRGKRHADVEATDERPAIGEAAADARAGLEADERRVLEHDAAEIAGPLRALQADAGADAPARAAPRATDTEREPRIVRVQLDLC